MRCPDQLNFLFFILFVCVCVHVWLCDLALRQCTLSYPNPNVVSGNSKSVPLSELFDTEL